MKKVKITFVFMILVVLITTCYYNIFYEEPHIIENSKIVKSSKSSAISMMLETKYASGVYEASSDTSWPSSGYTFNDSLSSCENGSTLTWDDTNKIVIVSGNVSDKCYIYFDAEKSASAVEALLALYTESNEGENDLYYFDGVGDYENASLEAVDYSYRYVGSDSYAMCIVDGHGVHSYEDYHTVITDEASCSTAYKITDESGYIRYYDETILYYVDTSNPVSVEWDDVNEYCVTSSGDELYSWYTGDYIYDEADCSGYAYYENYSFGAYVLISIEEVSATYTVKDSDVNNYVCFGSDDEICPSDNLYRIIGFFLNEEGEYEMKLIKADYATSDQLGGSGVGDYAGIQSTGINSYYWNYKNKSNTYTVTKYYNVWNYSQLNTVNLNTNFYNSFEEKWQDMIAIHTWIVGGNTYENIVGLDEDTGLLIYGVTAYSTYMSEIINYNKNQLSTENLTYSDEIGLMYVSDYVFAVSSEYWNVGAYNYEFDAYIYNWMYSGVSEWTISRSSSDIYNVFCIGYTGCVTSGVGTNMSYAVRPTFYLVSSTTITGGSGTSSDPYRISQ